MQFQPLVICQVESIGARAGDQFGVGLRERELILEAGLGDFGVLPDCWNLLQARAGWLG